MADIKNHKETLDEVSYSKDYTNESSSWKEYPKNRIKVELISYSWEYKNKENQFIPYSWKKVKISNTKLTTEDWQVVSKKKVINNKAVDDCTVCVLHPDDLNDLIDWLK